MMVAARSVMRGLVHRLPAAVKRGPAWASEARRPSDSAGSPRAVDAEGGFGTGFEALGGDVLAAADAGAVAPVPDPAERPAHRRDLPLDQRLLMLERLVVLLGDRLLVPVGIGRLGKVADDVGQPRFELGERGFEMAWTWVVPGIIAAPLQARKWKGPRATVSLLPVLRRAEFLRRRGRLLFAGCAGGGNK